MVTVYECITHVEWLESVIHFPAIGHPVGVAIAVSGVGAIQILHQVSIDLGKLETSVPVCVKAVRVTIYPCI